MKSMRLKHDLQMGKKKVGIWGLGYIGSTAMYNFAKEGIKCIGTDISKDVVNNINKSRLTIPNLEYWLGFDIKPLKPLIEATINWKDLIREEIGIHLIAVPTEKGAEPYDEILIDVIKKLCSYKEILKNPWKHPKHLTQYDITSYKLIEPPPMIIIESTITPNKIDELVIPLFKEHNIDVGSDIFLGVAPRRDWFISSEKSLKNLPRIVGGTNEITTEIMADVLSIVCNTILKASDHKHAAMVKSIENAYRHVGITLANQLTKAYPGVDMREVLKLVGTKWNIPEYHPSIGTGGYCIPVSSKYVIKGADHPDCLTILHETIKTDEHMPFDVVTSLGFEHHDIGILGLAYKGDLKVHVLSPTIKIVRAINNKNELQKKFFVKKSTVKVQDPYYTRKEIKEITGCETFKFPEELDQFDIIIIVAGHMIYKSVSQQVIKDKCKGIIIDNIGIWKDIDFSGSFTEYYVAGEANWLERPKIVLSKEQKQDGEFPCINCGKFVNDSPGLCPDCKEE